MFSENHDIRIRALVRFISINGKEKLANLLLSNQQKAIFYGHNKDYDGLGSEEKVISLLLSGEKNSE